MTTSYAQLSANPFSGVGRSMTETFTSGTEVVGQLPSSAADNQGHTVPANGLALSGLKAITPVLVAPTAAWSGSGSLQAYLFDPNAAAWTRCPDLDIVPTDGLHSQAFKPMALDAQTGWLCYLPAGMTISGNAKIVLTLTGSFLRRI